jgi:hypothetical protein
LLWKQVDCLLVPHGMRKLLVIIPAQICHGLRWLYILIHGPGCATDEALTEISTRQRAARGLAPLAAIELSARLRIPAGHGPQGSAEGVCCGDACGTRCARVTRVSSAVVHGYVYNVGCLGVQAASSTCTGAAAWEARLITCTQATRFVGCP